MSTYVIAASEMPSFTGENVGPSVDTLVLPPGVFKMNYPVMIRSGVPLRIEARDTMLGWGELPVRRPLFEIFERELTLTQKLWLNGGNPSLSWGDILAVKAREGQAGLQITGCGRFQVDAIAITNVLGDFIRVDNSHNGLIARCQFQEAGRHGVAVITGTNILIAGNVIHAANRWALDCEPNTSTGKVDKVTFVYNDTTSGVGMVSPKILPNGRTEQPGVTNLVTGGNTWTYG